MKILFIILTLLYPLVVYYGLAAFSIREVSIVLLTFFLLRLALTKIKSSKDNAEQTKHKSALSSLSLAIPVTIILLFSAISNNDIGVLFYPVVVNSSLAVLFLYSLYSPPPIIEKLARLKTANLPEKAIKYTRTVTKVWLVFFIINALIASYTALFTDIAIWTLYNGLISYLLMGILFTVEYLVRLRVQKSDEN